MGHRSLQMTLRYTQLYDRPKRAQYDHAMAQVEQQQGLHRRETMDDIRQATIDRFRASLERRQCSAHTVASDTLDLRVFFAEVPVPLAQVSFREVDQFVERQQHHGRAWATITRRLNALKPFFAFCVEQQLVRGNPVKPSHFVRRGHPLPKALAREQVQRLFAQIAHPMDRALFLVIRRCGLRVSEVAELKLEQIDWEQQALHIVQGKGRKDRRVYMSPDAVASLQHCLEQHPGAQAQGSVFWNRKRAQHPLSVKAIQKKIERYAKAAGLTASCHSLRHTLASNLLEHGAEVVAIRDFLGHSQIASSERYAKISRQKVKQEYLRTMQKILKQGPV
jgi:site-specific recombinase XerD